MNVLLIGSGGREHAIGWAVAQSDMCSTLHCIPGNAGIASFATCHALDVMDNDVVLNFVKGNAIDFVIVGPEAPLVNGLADYLRAAGIEVFGPSAKAAQLEGSKGFMKDLCQKYDIPTAGYGRFTDIESATAFIQKTGAPIVVKADGLAAGKGVIIAQTEEEAIEAARDMLSGASFGESGSSIVIEEFMDGEELSFFAFSDGQSILSLPSAQDHKRAFDGDEGPNTGGMGAYSPARLMDDALEAKIMDRIITPTVKAMEAEGCPFIGILFAGLMVVNGEPYLIEYNVRFGDPECQTILPRLQGDLLKLLQACAQGKLAEIKDTITWSSEVCICVVMAANGYPGSYDKGTVIKGIEEANAQDGVMVFHAGTAQDGDTITAIGGRVLGITASGDNIGEARARAYAAINLIDWPEGFCRSDIAWRAL